MCSTTMYFAKDLHLDCFLAISTNACVSLHPMVRVLPVFCNYSRYYILDFVEHAPQKVPTVTTTEFPAIFGEEEVF